MGGNQGMKDKIERSGDESKPNVTNRPLPVIVTFVFILINIVIWLALGIIIALNLHPSLPDMPVMKGIMAFLSLVMAGILFGLFIFIRKQNRIAYYLTLAFFIFNALLTIFDDVGLADLFVLVLNIIPIVLLVKDRAWYLKVHPQMEGNV